MAEEELAEVEEEQQEEESGGKGGLIRLLAVLMGVVLMGATASLVVWKMVLQPRLVDAGPVVADTGPKILPDPFMVPFDSAIATVIMPSDDYLASILMYSIELECSDQVAMDLVTKHKARFIDMIRKLHASRTREVLKDPMTAENIQKQIVQESNAILMAILVENEADSRVTNAFHTQWFVKDE
jgi:flagellar basal body-associated protein FliL